MERRIVVVGLLALLVAGSVAGSGYTTPANGFADVLVGDVVIGESEQHFPGLRAVEFPTDAETVTIELDLAVLMTHGVNVSDAEVELPDGAVRGGTVETATVDNGTVRLVFVPDDSIDDAIIEVEGFSLSGLDTAAAEAASGLRFDARYSAGEPRVRSFDIVDPDDVTASLETTPLFADASTHRVTLRDVHAVSGKVTVELDVRVLQAHGFDLADLGAEVTADGASVWSTTVDQGIVTVVVSPDEDTVLFDVRMVLKDLGSPPGESDGRVIASDVTYGVTVAGAGGDDVVVEPFDIARHPTTNAGPVTTWTTTSGSSLLVEGDGFGLVAVVVAIVLLSLLVKRRT